MVTPLTNSWLTQQLNEKEVREVLFSFDSGKLLGQDRYSAKFFKALLPELKVTIMSCVYEFFKVKPLLKASNHNVITLIPKDQLLLDVIPVSLIQIRLLDLIPNLLNQDLE